MTSTPAPGPEISAKSVRAKNVRRVASQVLAQLHLAARVQQLYSGDNDNVRKAYDGLEARLQELCSFERGLVLHLEDGYLFANDVRMRVDPQSREAHFWALERFAESGLASLAIERDVRPVELRKLVPVIARAAWPEGGAPPPIAKDLAAAFVVNVKVTMRRSRDIASADAELAEISSGKLALALWRRLHRAATEACEACRAGAPLPLKKGRALVQVLIDALLEDEAALLAATRAKNFAPEGLPVESPHQVYLESHIANTTVLALGLGSRLGLARRQLLDLGAAALVADVGMVHVPREARERKGPLTAGDRVAVTLHPLRAAEAILGADESARVNQICAAAAAQHHPRGYSQGSHEGRPGLLASIIAVADAYDALTTERPWRPARGHAEALAELISGKGGHPKLLVKVFANFLGRWPVGAVLELSTGETAIVVDQGEGAQLGARPRVKVLLEKGGAPSKDGRVLDLAERGAGAVFVRSAVRMLDIGGAAAGAAGELAAMF